MSKFKIIIYTLSLGLALTLGGILYAQPTNEADCGYYDPSANEGEIEGRGYPYWYYRPELVDSDYCTESIKGQVARGAVDAAGEIIPKPTENFVADNYVRIPVFLHNFVLMSLVALGIVLLSDKWKQRDGKKKR